MPYTSVSSLPSPPGSIDEDVATREQGLKVHLGRKDIKGIRTFSVTPLLLPSSSSSSSYLSSHLFFLLFTSPSLSLPFSSFLSSSLLIAGGSSVVGGLFLTLYAYSRIVSYLNNPESLCSVMPFVSQSYFHTDVMVRYLDWKNVSRTHLLSHHSNINWKVQSEFSCVYQSDFVIDKQTLEDNFRLVESQWYMGFVIPFAVCLAMALLDYLLIRFLHRSDTTFCYPPSSAIPDWEDVGPLFRVLLSSYHFLEDSTIRETHFTRYAQSYKIDKFQLLFALLLVLSTSFLFGFSATFLNGFDFSFYCLSVFYILIGIVCLALTMMVVYVIILPGIFVETDELKIDYTIQFGVMLGTIERIEK